MPVFLAPSESSASLQPTQLASLSASANSSEKATNSGKTLAATDGFYGEKPPTSTLASAKTTSEVPPGQSKVEGLTNGATVAIVVGIILVLAACMYAVWLMIQDRRRERRDSATTDPLSRWSPSSHFPMHHLGSPGGGDAGAGSDTGISTSSIGSAKVQTATAARRWPQASAAGEEPLTWAAPWRGPASGCGWSQGPVWPRPIGAWGQHGVRDGEHF
ncbi:hypothetical protein HIM_02802 [Hirsutella minnesotensis 3608]|nr:hypothetical protein HIM_02802 [Hirsutella minnesotensis 3608]